MVVTVLTASWGGDFTSIAPVGQTERHWPQVVHTDSTSGRSMKVPMRPVRPVPRKSIAPMNWWPSWHAWAHRPQRMQSSMAMSNTGLLASTGSRSRLAQRGASMPCSLAATVSSRWPFSPSPFAPTIAEVSSSTAARTSRALPVPVQTFIPSAAGTEHEAGRPRIPSTSTRQVRHAPMASMSGSLQSWEMYVPDALMASSTVAPSGTWTSLSSIRRVMVMAIRSTVT